jgi:hypothetical protein
VFPYLSSWLDIERSEVIQQTQMALFWVSARSGTGAFISVAVTSNSTFLSFAWRYQSGARIVYQ